ncbi:RagB/SusD family nutrient uptake outer membrane protein [Sphingobacterium humi]|uniref:RagB/SusD family nutrient uptake outer membrane protein n=1 Tax=Sphingobacterium humi TaxID=1796905 RepID=A0A6N8KWF0_9SPHI|nr:RagB/SusD family nutrient uptake outer membrane protein [Sphingobacterium humi]MVZ61059.1 RagB/SusD family nutrient uptake outer membrane protein [Sphingobacterium humi]
MKAINYLLCACLLSGSLSSCKKWLDVQPKTNISERVLFENEQGFKDALSGVYILMANQGLYAREFTMATMDVLAQQYDVSSSTHTYYETGKYNYKDAGLEGRINQFWNRGYQAIANLNNLLEAIDEKKGLFTDNNYSLIKGEALGLRAFLHFDLYRAFGAIPSKDMESKMLPYVTRFEMKVTSNLSGKDFVAACMKDLNESIELLSAHKEVNYGVADPFRSHTRNHFNFWAAHGLKARIALYAGDTQTALQSAQTVIENAKLFPFVTRTSLISGAPSRTFLSEQLFSLYMPTLRDINEGLFKSSAAPSLLTNQESFITKLFEGSSTDFRWVFLWKEDGVPAKLMPVKYWEDDIQTNTLNTRRVPLIRLSEVYYIAAEAATSSTEKIKYLNVVRSNRGLNDLPQNLEEALIQEEIFKEYRKEFYQEGQLFFYYKRKNKLRIDGYGLDMSAREYILPKPNDELEFNKN